MDVIVKSKHNTLQLSHIDLDENYRNEWNERMNDFVMLTKDGNLISNSLYRVGGLGADITKKYFILLKYVEDYYDADIMKISKSKSPKHLSGRWVILNRDGVEKVEFAKLESPYLVSDSCIYFLNRKYYNIETGFFYCEASSVIQSESYLFLENKWDSDKSKRGVMKIEKETGNFELIQ